MADLPRTEPGNFASRVETTRSVAPQVDSVPLLDIGRENSQLELEIVAAMTQVAKSGRFVMGPECQQLEQRVANLCNTKHALGCASGSEALLLSCMAANIGPGDEVIVPSFTFFATASAVWRLGAKPVFVDIEPESFNMDPESVVAALSPRTKAIIAVHLFGQAADMQTLQEIATEHELVVIEDAAQAIGASFDGHKVGSIGDVGCFSFYPTKNLGGFGDGGMLTTNSDEFADKLKLLRVHGMEPRYYHEVVGVNSRLDTLQAAVLNIKLPHLDEWSAARAANAALYRELFEQAAVPGIVVPTAQPRRQHVWNQFTVRIQNGLRDQLRQYLASKHVGTEIYYPVPLHQQRCFADLKQPIALPETERAAEEVLSLPIFPNLTAAELETVVYHTAEFLSHHAQRDYRSVA